MDQLLSQIIPTQRIGNDGFNWWIGQIEGTASDEEKNKGGYRYKVRIVGDHPGSKEILDTADLPWANVIMPVNVPFMPGNRGGGHPSLEIGCWVIGFYLDNDKQKPMIMGSIGQTPGATKVFNERTPDTKPFETAVPQVNTATDGVPKQEGTDKNTATGGLADGTKDGDGNPRVNVPSRKKIAPKDEEWCQTVAEKCDDPDISTQMTTILGEFLYEVQRNGGNIGTYLVNQASGKLNEGVGIARKYVNKAMRVVREFIARVKGFIIEKLTNAVKDLIKAVLRPSEDGNALTPVTEFFNRLLKNLGCQMADLGDRLAEWLTNVLMSYVNQIYRAVACQIDALVNGILSKLNSLMEELLGAVLGPIQAILGAIAGPLNIIGGAINFVLKLLGISCSGPDQTCAKYKQICVNGEEKKKGNDKDFLDDLLGSIDNLFPATGADYTQYTCSDAYKGNNLAITTVGFTGGVPRTDGPSVPSTRRRQINYTIDDVTVEEGDEAQVTVTRTGFIESASSVNYRTIAGTATENEDYYPESGILGFAPNETEKTINVRTFYSQEFERDENFYIVLTPNSPSSGSGISVSFYKNTSTITITEVAPSEDGDPYVPRPQNPFDEIDNEFPPDETDVPLIDDEGNIDDGTIDEDGDGIDDETGRILSPTYRVVPDRTSVFEGEFVVYTIFTRRVPNGSILYYTLTGDSLEPTDILDGRLTGSFRIYNNTARVTVGIAEDNVVETAELLRFTINNTGAFADVIISPTVERTVEDYDLGEGETPENTYEEFRPPTVNPDKIITDENGGIIEIPIEDPGDPWAEPPFVFIGGEGIGATATGLLDQDGFLKEIRIKSNGYGYRKNLAKDNGVRCIIDTFTVIRPGERYTDKPKVYVDGELGVAEAIINDDGFVIGALVLDRTKTYAEFPEIVVVGGGGFGAKLLPSLVCLDTPALSTIGSTKIGTGRYVDCP